MASNFAQQMKACTSYAEEYRVLNRLKRSITQMNASNRYAFLDAFSAIYARGDNGWYFSIAVRAGIVLG